MGTPSSDSRQARSSHARSPGATARPKRLAPWPPFGLAAADFIPADKADDWHNAGAYVSCHSGSCEWVAPVVFPCLPAVTVERIKLHVYDNNGSQNACADVYRAQPAKAAFLFLGGACSPVAGTTGNPQTFTSEAINQVVRPSQGAFIWLSVRGASIAVYGVTVEYHQNI